MKAVAFAVFLSSFVVIVYLVAQAPGPPPAAQVAARRVAEAMTQERAAALARGDLESWASAMDERAVIVPWSGGIRRGPREAAGTPVRLEGEEPVPSSLAVGASRRGRIAWSAVALAGDSAGRLAPLRQSTTFLLAGGQWRVVLEHHSRASDWGALRDARVSDRAAPVGTVGRVERPARSLAKRFERWMSHPGRTRLERDMIGVGPAHGAFAVGDSSGRLLLEELESRLGPLRVVPGSLLATVSRGGGAGWVLADVEARPRDWGGDVLPLRVSAAFRSRGEDSWGLAMVHVSARSPAAAGPSPLP